MLVKICEQKFPIILTLGILDSTSTPTDAMRQTLVTQICLKSLKESPI